jgi:outer membrane immunogenic protein
MKRNIIGGLAVSALLIAAPLSAASAADMPLKAPPAPAPVYSWTGFYGGVNVGYSWGRSSTDWSYFAPNITSGSTVCGAGAYCISGSGTENLNGVIGGFQAGYNWQTGNLLAGIEADFQGSGQRGTQDFTTPFTASAGAPGTGSESFTEKLRWFGTLRGRIGYAPGQWLFYATGGLAYGRVTVDGSMAATGFFSPFVPGSPPCPAGTLCPVANFSNSATKAGWTLGVGTERALDGHWSFKAEYLFVDLGSVTTSFSGVPGCFGNAGICNNTAAGAGTISNRITDNIFRVGLNYKLGGP